MNAIAIAEVKGSGAWQQQAMGSGTIVHAIGERRGGGSPPIKYNIIGCKTYRRQIKRLVHLSSVQLVQIYQIIINSIRKKSRFRSSDFTSAANLRIFLCVCRSKYIRYALKVLIVKLVSRRRTGSSLSLFHSLSLSLSLYKW